MTKLASFLTTCSVVLLSACGGGSGGSNSSTAGADTVAPTMTGLTTNFEGTGNVTLAASATDNAGVTGYCFRTVFTSPLGTDSCFQASNQKAVNLSLPQQRYYVWAKDAAGNVSASPMIGPCSSAGFTASDASTLNTVCMMTSQGEMVFALNTAEAPVSVTNFLKYVNDGFYSNTVFHRVISNFMVQGGGYTWSTASGYTAKTPTYAPIALEPPSTTGLSNLTGTIAMARTSILNSATSQFFVNVVDNVSLDASGGGYAVFGSLISGNDALSALKLVPVVANSSGEISQPTTAPVIQWAIQLR